MWNEHVKSGVAAVVINQHFQFTFNDAEVLVSASSICFYCIIKGLTSKSIIKDRKQKKTQHIHQHHYY